MKESIIMTVADREPELLMNVLRWLRFSYGPSGMFTKDESEVVLVDDGSTLDYTFVEAAYPDVPVRWVKMAPYEAYRIRGTYNNPAKAFNAALEAARGERVCILSSDVIVPPQVMTLARGEYNERAVWSPMVIDLGTGSEYCGPHRVFPMPWMLYTSRALLVEAGGWDENYLKGLCFDDNDVVGRLALCAERFILNWSAIAWHQSHFQPAYEPGEAAEANDRNRLYTLEKWKGMPFGEADQIAFAIRRGRDEATGNFCLTFEDIRDCKAGVIAATNSPFVEVPAC